MPSKNVLDHPVIDILKTLDSKELKSLTHFIECPYFNGSKIITSLFNYIRKYYPKFSHSSLNKEQLAILLGDTKPVEDSAVRDYLAKLLNLILQFLIQQNLQKKDNISDTLLLSELANRNLPSLFERETGKAQERLRKDLPERDKFYTKYYLYALLFNNLSENSKVRKAQQAETEIRYMYRSAQYLLAYNFTSYTETYCNLFVHESKFVTGHTDSQTVVGWIENLMPLVETIDTDEREEITLINLYISLYKAYRHIEDSSYYFNYKKRVVASQEKLNAEEVSFHYAKLIAYAVLQKRISAMNDKWNNELKDLYSEFLEGEFFITKYEKHLSPNLFRDIFINAINTEDMRWFSFFIEKYSEKLNPKFKDNLKTFAQAFLLFNTQGCLEEALTPLNQVDLDYFMYKYDVKKMKLIIYYEIKDYPYIEPLIHSFEEALRKDKLTPFEIKEQNRLFLKYFKKLHSYQDKPKDLGFDERKLQKEKNFPHKRWMVEKYKYITHEKNKKLHPRRYRKSIN